MDRTLQRAEVVPSLAAHLVVVAVVVDEGCVAVQAFRPRLCHKQDQAGEKVIRPHRLAGVKAVEHAENELAAVGNADQLVARVLVVVQFA